MKFHKILRVLLLLTCASVNMYGTTFENSTPSFHIIQPVVQMRENPAHDAKVVSQAIFSETILVQQEEGEWSYIMTPDGYTGWVLANAFVAGEEHSEPNRVVTRLSAHIYHVKDTEYGPMATLPYGAKVHVLDQTDARWIKISLPDNTECFIQKGDVATELPLLEKSEVASYSKKFLGLPYTWGGRSSFGYDCSGFVQMLYQHMGVNLLRDSKQQVLDSRFQTIDLEDLEPGDLIFFGKSAQKITHVALSLGGDQFIHSTVRENQPWIRISSLNDFEWSGDSGAISPYRIARRLIGN